MDEPFEPESLDDDYNEAKIIDPELFDDIPFEIEPLPLFELSEEDIDYHTLSNACVERARSNGGSMSMFEVTFQAIQCKFVEKYSMLWVVNKLREVFREEFHTGPHEFNADIGRKDHILTLKHGR